MFPLILQAHMFPIVIHNTTITLFLVPLNERESRGGQTVLLSVRIFVSSVRIFVSDVTPSDGFVSEAASLAGFVSGVVTRTSPPAGRSLLHARPWSRSSSLISCIHNPLASFESCFLTRFPTRTAYQNDLLQSLRYATPENPSLNLIDVSTMIITYNLTHVLPHQPSHVLIILTVVLYSTDSKCNHVVTIIASPDSILEDVPAPKIHFIINAMKSLMLAGKHTSVSRKRKQDSTKIRLKEVHSKKHRK